MDYSDYIPVICKTDGNFHGKSYWERISAVVSLNGRSVAQQLTKGDFVDGDKVVIRFGGKDYEGIVKLGDDTKDIRPDNGSQDNSLVTAHINLAASVSAESGKECVVSTNSSSVAITSSALEAPPKTTSTAAVKVSPKRPRRVTKKTGKLASRL